MKDLKSELRKLVDKYGVYDIFSELEDVAYDKDVEEHKANPMKSDYYWPGVIGVSKTARESMLGLDAKRRESDDSAI